MSSSDEEDAGTIFTRTSTVPRYPQKVQLNANGDIGLLITWPQQKLSYTFTSRNITYQDLDFPLLVAGELGVILSPDATKRERECRLRLLQMVAYQIRSRPWESVRKFHKECLEHAQEVAEWNPFDFLNNEASMMSSVISDKLNRKPLISVNKRPVSLMCTIQ